MIRYPTHAWLGVMLRVRGTVLPRILVRCLLVVALASAAYWLRLEQILDVSIPGTAHALVGVALGLLLVFRTNASYDRFWEGRKLIGGLVNNCRDLARQGSTFLAVSPEPVRVRFGVYVEGLFVTIRRYLRAEQTWPELAGRLTDVELATLATVRAPPLYLAHQLGNLLAEEAKAGRLTEERLRMLDGTVSDIIDFWGGAERILRTPVPLAYAHHIKTFLFLFCMTVPMALVEPMGLMSPIAAGIVAYGLFGIDEIGVEIEDPFGYDANDLPLDEIGEVVATDVAQMLAIRSRAP